jgi:glycerophosphoryl diester phosphodiesterase
LETNKSAKQEPITLDNYAQKKNELGISALHQMICSMAAEGFEQLVSGLSQKELLELRGPRIAAHRGRGVNVKPNDWPENTLAAAKSTIQQFNASDPHGGHAIECDIHVTKDGYAILVHGPLVVNNLLLCS